MYDIFSIFISLGKYSNENLSLMAHFEAIQLFSAENGVSIRNQCLSPLEKGARGLYRKDRIVFDLLTDQKASVKDCDIQCLSNESESIAIFGGNEWELRKAGLFDEKDIGCFISQLALLLFIQGEYQVGLVSTEDTFTSLSFKEFHPGYWTIFSNDMFPQFVSGLPFASVNEMVRVYRHEQLAGTRFTPEQMGRDIRRIVPKCLKTKRGVVGHEAEYSATLLLDKTVE